MKSYKIKIVSQGNSIIALALFFALFFPFILTLQHFSPPPHSKLYGIIFVIPTLLSLYFIFQKIATAKTEWLVDEKNITIIWLTQFSFRKSETIKINWSEISNYKKRLDPMYETIQIKLKDGKSYNFYHSNSPLLWGDDFKELAGTVANNYHQNTKHKK